MQLVKFQINTKQSKRSFGGIISYYKYASETHDVHIDFNTKFFEFFLESMLTYINFTMRRQLKRDGSKALFRFICAHKKPGRMHMVTILKAINYNTEQPMSELRRRLKQFLNELKANSVLGKKTKLYKDDTVYLDVLKPSKKLPD